MRGPLNEKGRQNVYVEGAEKSMLLKPANLDPEPRHLDTLTAAELKAVLVAKGSPAAAAVLDVDALRELVECEVMPDDDLSLLIAQVGLATTQTITPLGNTHSARGVGALCRAPDGGGARARTALFKK